MTSNGPVRKSSFERSADRDCRLTVDGVPYRDQRIFNQSRIMPLLFLLVIALAGPRFVLAAEPLPSWNEGPTKQAILAFVAKVATPGSPDFVPEAERIAVFDNDGTLWSEQPIYFQAAYIFDRIRELAPQHPEWKQEEPFASALRGDVPGALSGGVPALLALTAATHAGVTATEFRQSVRSWLATARHPGKQRAYEELVFQPMLEVLAYLRAHGFATYIVSGGGTDFLRVFAEEVYGIPPEQIIGSRLKATYEVRDGAPAIIKQAEIAFVDDKSGKPVGIHDHIGRRPIAAFGNSDGDFEMLEWTTSGKGVNLGLIVHHDDATREWAYDRASHIGQLDRGLDEAPGRGWLVASMKNDWRVIYPPADNTTATEPNTR